MFGLKNTQIKDVLQILYFLQISGTTYIFWLALTVTDQTAAGSFHGHFQKGVSAWSCGTEAKQTKKENQL